MPKPAAAATYLVTKGAATATATATASQTQASAVVWDKAYGAFLGVLCGDAAGATLEFFRGELTEAVVARAMRMPGGGAMRVGPGQITDDSELALSLARGLVGHAPRDGFPLNAVAQQYCDWLESPPFDIGNTCHNAFSLPRHQDSESLGRLMVDQSARLNAASEANGSLMRILPLALWALNEPVETIARLARQEATLSHPNQVCQDCNAVYCVLVVYLIKHPGDHLGAIKHAEEFVRNHVTTKVREWFLSESLDIATLDCSKSIGHERWAFVQAVYYLRNNQDYERAIRETLLRGGDTDTNAAIVGGLIADTSDQGHFERLKWTH